MEDVLEPSLEWTGALAGASGEKVLMLVGPNLTWGRPLRMPLAGALGSGSAGAGGVGSLGRESCPAAPWRPKVLILLDWLSEKLCAEGLIGPDMMVSAVLLL